MQWAWLAGAIVTEAGGTLALRMAALGRRIWYAAVVVGYVLAFACLSLALAAGMPLAVGYGIWSAVGVAITAVASHLLFREPLTRLMLCGVALIMVGVLLVEVGATH